MSDDAREAIEGLIEYFDLGEYEVEAYLAILRHGTMTASEITESTSVPQPRVYDTVRALADDGLVELQESRPMRVVAVEPEEAFAAVRDTFDRLLDKLQGLYQQPAGPAEAVTLVKSRSALLRHMARTIDVADLELAVAIPPALLDRFQDDLAAAVDRDVLVDLLLSPAQAAPSPEEFPYRRLASDVRLRRGRTTPVILVADGRRAVFTTPDALKESGVDRYGVIFDRSTLGFLLNGFFSAVLESTAEFLLERAVEPDFPRTYATIRRCVKDLSRARGRFTARVDGRRVNSGEPCVVEGAVVDIEFDPDLRIASLTVESTEGHITIGGRVAAYEDVEAHSIDIDRREDPSPSDD